MMANDTVEEIITSPTNTGTLGDLGTKDTSVSELRKVRDRELMLKRLAGDISCAECRRMKLKCDKKIPCTSCVKRKCSGICPIATMLDEDSADLTKARQFKGAKERQLLLMSRRICILEDALYLSQECGDSHPLLTHELLRIKQKDGLWDEPEEPQREETDWNDNGTLMVGEHDEMRYVGASATEHVLLAQLLYSKKMARQTFYTALPSDIVQASTLFPFIPDYLTKSSLYAELVSRLPDYPRVTALVEAYFSNLAWFAGPIDRAQIQGELIPLFYPKRRPISPSAFHETMLHSLALLFTLLASGSVADLTLDAINPEAEELDQLARAALALRSIFDHGSLEACQTLVLLGLYEMCTGRENSSESVARLINFGVMIAASLGLHRDPARFGIDSKMADRRRRIFWQLNCNDKSKALGSGQPMIFDPMSIDCELPFDQDAIQEEDGTIVESVWHWRYRFTKEVITPLSEATSTAKRVKYSKILELNDLVERFQPHTYSMREAKPLSDGVRCSGNDEFSLISYLHPLVTVWYKQMAIERLHRNYFARAIIESPIDPRKSVYAPSFKAVFESSKILLKLIMLGYPKLEKFLLRLPPIWANSLACAVVIGSTATKVRVPEIADDALQVLNAIVETFKHAANHTIPAASLSFLLSLQRRAREARDERTGDQAEGCTTSLPVIRGTPSTLEDELHILRGGTRFMTSGNLVSDSDRVAILDGNDHQSHNQSSTLASSSAPSGHPMTGLLSSSVEMSPFSRFTSPPTSISEVASPLQFVIEAMRMDAPTPQPASTSSGGAPSSSSSLCSSPPTSVLSSRFGFNATQGGVTATNMAAQSGIGPQLVNESASTTALHEGQSLSAASFESIFGLTLNQQQPSSDSSPEDFLAADTVMWDSLVNDFGLDFNAILI